MSALAFALLFYAERARFAAAFPASSVGAAGLRFTEAPCPLGKGCRGRDYAVARWGGSEAPTITFSTRVLALPRDNALALVRHELAHIADPTPNAARPEHRADRIASVVGGRPIRYDRRAVQTVGAGGPRPRRLPP